MLREIVDLVYPRSCLSCGARGHPLWCAACATAVAVIGSCCARCGFPAPESCPACGSCVALCPPVRRARAFARYEGPVRDAVMAFKLGGQRRVATAMALCMADVAPRAGLTVTFVPGTRRVVAARGFDPALELARPLARALGLPLRRLLRKVIETADQAGLDRKERAANLRGAFEASAVTGGVLLVDDVMTTGATAAACATALREAGAPWVDVVTFARVALPR